MSENNVQTYRKDIQGLRGIAVLLVLVYHSGIAMPGGFIGVDIFFVISGFVIAQLLISELEQTGRVSLSNFYSRRARRLLPALATVTITTVVFSLFAFSPFGAQQDVASTALATSVFGANFYLLLQNTYSNLGSNPLRHMWSLGVEEQFYLLLPLFMIFIWRVGVIKSKNPRLIVGLTTFLLGVSSFFVCFELSRGRASKLSFRLFETTPERIAFFTMPTRAWEFAIGISVAVLFGNRKRLDRSIASAVSALCFGSLIWAAFAITTDNLFPGWLALMPTVSTALIIFCGNNSRFNNVVLGNKVLVFLGDISYGLYLWHWPFVVFADAIWPTGSFVKIVATIFSFVPTLVMYRFMETPIRLNKQLVGKQSILLTAICIFLPFSMAISANTFIRKVQDHFVDQKLGWQERRVAILKGCYGNIESDWLEDNCVDKVSETAETVLVVGDSQAASASDGVLAAVKSLNLNIAYSTYPGCPMFKRAPRDSAICQQVVEFQLSLIEKLNPRVVVISNAGYRYTWAGLEVSRPDSTGGGFPTLIFEKELAVSDSYSEMINQLLDGDRKIVVLLEPPFVQFSKQISLIRQSSEIVPLNLAEQSSRLNINKNLTSNFIDESRVSIVSVDDIVCPDKFCLPKLSGRWIYMENSHLNPEGSKLLESRIAAAIVEQLKG